MRCRARKSLPPADPTAARVVALLGEGRSDEVLATLDTSPGSAGKRGPAGVTPLMAASLYGDARLVAGLLELGADPEARNDAGVTALTWAVASGDAGKVRLLLARGADPNARSHDERTPLMVAASRYGSADTVRLLLDRGADPSASAGPGPFATTPLTEAAYAGDGEVFRMLVDAGADLKRAGPVAVLLATRSACRACLELLSRHIDKETATMASLLLSPPFGDATGALAFIERGADPNGRDPEGRTALMLAASSDAIPVDTVKALIGRGADVNASTERGETALGFARLRGQTPLVDLLVKAGARDLSPPAAPVPAPHPAASARAAVERSLPLLQRSDQTFLRKSGCVSCHNNSLTAMTTALARTRGFPVDDSIVAEQKQTVAAYLENWRERVLQNMGIPGDADTVSYILLGLAAEDVPPDMATDAMAHYLRGRQHADGHWWILAHRPPIESSDIQVTATSLRALQAYAPRAHHREFAEAVRRAAVWLEGARPASTEDHAFRLLGLHWAGGADAGVLRSAARALVAGQRPDGGWAQIPSLPSDAYATGQALFALAESGTLPVSDPVYVRGVQFLLSTQRADGSWYVRSRALPIQPHFESDFPYERDQFVSAAATNWAALALIHAVR
jgi:ankyrin repeat protein